MALKPQQVTKGYKNNEKKWWGGVAGGTDKIKERPHFVTVQLLIAEYASGIMIYLIF